MRCPILQVRLPPVVLLALHERAEQNDCTPSALARLLLAEALGMDGTMPPHPGGPGRPPRGEVKQ